MLLCASIRYVQFCLGIKKPIVFAFTPIFNGLIGHLNEKAVIYYCIDDLRGYAGVDIAWFDREENRLLNESLCVISCSKKLYETFSGRGYHSYYIPHGVDWSLFRRAVSENLPEPEDMRNIPHPRLGFYGFLSEEWVDYTLLKNICCKHPEWQIVLIGKQRSGMNLKALMPEPNVHYLGVKPFEELPAYTKYFDVGLIPFTLNKLTLSSNPLKLLEYLSGGVPVVATAIPETRAYASKNENITSTPDVFVADSYEEFIQCCELAISNDNLALRQQRSEKVRQHSWELRIRDISKIVRTELSGKEE
jgi:glycosyltransferase involved in cell wall biosynthesis